MNHYRLFRWSAYSGFIPSHNEDYEIFNDSTKINENHAIKVIRHNEPKPKRQGGDLVNFNPIIVSQTFVEKMGAELQKRGCFYPISTVNENQPYWIFKVENIIDGLDFNKCTGSINPWYPEKSDVRYSSINSFSLKNNIDSDSDTFIFQTPQYKGMYTFVNEDFIEKIGKFPTEPPKE